MEQAADVDEADQGDQNGTKMTLEEKLAEMKAEEEERSAEVMGIESQHKRLAEAHRDGIIRLRGINDELKQIEADFKAKCDEYRQVVKTCNELGDEMNRVSEERRARVAELEALRARIEKLQIIEVGVYFDGKIECFDHPELEFDDTGYEEVYDRLLKKPECQELKLKDVQILARLLRIMETSPAKINVAFDNEDLELVFMLITESEST